MDYLLDTIQPGLYPGMPDAKYREIPYTSHSDLKDYVRGQAMPKTRRLIVGNALHVLMLFGSEEYEAQYHECHTEYKLNKKADKDEFKTIEADFPDKTVIRPSEYRLVGEMAKQLYAHPDASKFFKAPGENELCVVADLEGYATRCKCLLDMKRRGCLADLKTTGYRDRNEFKNAIVDFGYASQAAFYIDLYAAITGEYLPWFFVCVSKDTLEVWVEQITPEQLAFGRRWYRDVLLLKERSEIPF